VPPDRVATDLEREERAVECAVWPSVDDVSGFVLRSCARRCRLGAALGFGRRWRRRRRRLRSLRVGLERLSGARDESRFWAIAARGIHDVTEVVFAARSIDDDETDTPSRSLAPNTPHKHGIESESNSNIANATNLVVVRFAVEPFREGSSLPVVRQRVRQGIGGSDGDILRRGTHERIADIAGIGALDIDPDVLRGVRSGGFEEEDAEKCESRGLDSKGMAQPVHRGRVRVASARRSVRGRAVIRRETASGTCFSFAHFRPVVNAFRR
jgi:hypothetical protein